MALLLSFIISTIITIPKILIEKKFLASNTIICVKKGNLLLEKGNIAITSSNYFDLNKHKKSSNSIKQQLIKTDFKDNLEGINKLIEESLLRQGIKGKQNKKKEKGKKIKYDIGTTAVVPVEHRKILLVIMTKLNLKEGKKRTESNLEYLQKGLNSLWKLYDSEGNLEPLSIPVFGSGLSKISLSRLIFIQLIIMSYVSYARTRRITKRLNIVINEKNYNPEEFYQIEKFIKSIEF
ncbi:macro domain-containing protein [uncultured Dokdonia sp.]|uniref:macro domain-containing protein n=1 Tax=uncultured Dokdonia sp. TaxID=575653 RepID=UPI0026319F71|nr:macro domain-containing protein [uncultured Dokdonia sp.]